MELLFTLQNLSDWGVLVLRLALGSVFLAHGLSKWGTWKMQPGEQMSGGMLNTMRFLSIAEPLGATAVMFGFLTQVAALGLACVMLGAIWMKARVWKTGFMVMASGGWEFDLMNLASAIVLILGGAGSFSIDRVLFGL